MLPDLTVLIALLVGLGTLSPATTPPPLAPWGTLVLVATVATWTRHVAQRGVEAIEDGAGAVALASTRGLRLGTLAAWLVCLSAFDWGVWAATVVPRVVWMAPYVVLLLPLAVMFAFTWVAENEVEIAFARTRGIVPRVAGPRQAVRAGLRRNALIAAPLFVLLGLGEALHVAGELGVEPARRAGLWLEHFELLQLGVFVLLLAIALPALPAIAGRLMRASPLPPGSLQTRLVEIAASLRLPLQGIYLWNTQGRILNAMVVGFGRTRRIFLTDRLVASMPEEEIAAVFLHEAGHAVRRHIPLYIVLVLSLALWIGIAHGPLVALGIPPFLILVGQLALFWFVLLGVISRRFEREADFFTVDFGERVPREPAGDGAAEGAVSVPAIHLMRAFERLHHATGGQSPAHRHGTLESRAQMLASYAGDDSVRRRERAVSRRLRVGIALFTAGGVLFAARAFPEQVDEARAAILAAEGDRLERRALERPEADIHAERLWISARDAWRGAAERDPRAERAADARLHAAEISLDHLDDVVEARTDIDALRIDPAPTTPGALWIAFRAETLSARLAAREGDLVAAERAIERASLRHDALRGPFRGDPETMEWIDEILRLSRAIVDAAAPDEARRALARRRLADLAGGTSPEPARKELRIVARRALDRLGPVGP